MKFKANIIACVLMGSFSLGLLNYGYAAPLSSNQKIQRLENQVQYLNQYINKIQQLETDDVKLKAQIAQTNQLFKQYQANAIALSFLKKRVMQLEATSQLVNNAPSHSKALSIASKRLNKVESNNYQLAYSAIINSEYKTAIKRFNQFVKQYPNSHLASDAYYWLGELYLTEGQPDIATQQFRKVISNRQSDKRPNALLALGTIFLANGDLAHAKQNFDTLIKSYPKSASAKKAQSRLKSMGQN